MLEIDKKSRILYVVTDEFFDLEKLAKKEPQLLNELMEKYPLKNDVKFIIHYHKPEAEATGDEEVLKEIAEIISDDTDVSDDEPEQETVETEDAATQIEPLVSKDDFLPLYSSAEHITIKYDYDRVVEKLTILEVIPVYTDKVITGYDYKVIVERGTIKIYHEDFLVENEIVEE